MKDLYMTQHDSPSPIVCRFAPSPSGRMHLGNVASCLIAWLSARAAHGRIVLRIEDLDPRANSPEVARLIIDDLHWLGLEWDEGPYYQHERLSLYQDALARLSDIDAGSLVYPCFCTRRELHAASAPHASDGTYVYPGICRSLTPQQRDYYARLRKPALRLRVPEVYDQTGTITFEDLCYGPQREVLAQSCGDFLVQRSDGVIAYQLAVVVDDADMGITQVVRGRDLLTSSPRQIYLQRLLGYPQPHYGHIPLLVAADGRRLSKRNHDLDLEALKQRFTTSQQLISALAYQFGLTEAGEIVELDELVSRFSWTTIAQHRLDIHVDEGFLL